MKRLISILLIMTLLFGTMTSISGCGSKNESRLSYAQWIQMVDEAFGMQSYSTETPFFSNIGVDNPYFGYVQAAVEWNVIPKEKDLQLSKELIWNDALLSLVCAGRFLEEDASDEEKIQFAKDNFDNSIRDYSLNWEISAADATKLLDVASQMWLNKHYDEYKEEVVFSDEVKDFSQGENMVTDYFFPEENVIAIPLNDNVSVIPGDVFILPGNEIQVGTEAYQADDVAYDEQYMYVKTATEVSIDNFIENVESSGSYVATPENTIIQDAYGNVIYDGTSNQVGINKTINGVVGVATVTPVIGAINTTTVKPVTFDVDGWKIELGVDVSKNIGVSVNVKSPDIKAENGTIKGKVSTKISDIAVTHDMNIKHFSIKDAYLKVDYTSKIEPEFEYKSDVINKTFAPYNNGNGKFLTNLKKSKWKDSTSKGAKTIKVGSVTIKSIGIARVCLDINAKIAVNGSVSFSITERGCKGIEYSNGRIRTINESNRDNDFNIKGKIEATMAFGPALYTVGLKESIIGVQVAVGAGAEISVIWHLVDSENHLIEELNFSDSNAEKYDELLTIKIEADPSAIAAVAESQGGVYKVEEQTECFVHFENCIDLNVYFILRLQLKEDSLVTKSLNKYVETSWEICGKKNASVLKGHCEDGVWKFNFGVNSESIQCTKKYQPFDKIAETEKGTEDEKNTEEKEINEFEENTEEILSAGELIILEQVKYIINVGEAAHISVKQIPKGYMASDLVFKSDSREIAEVDTNGNVTAVKAGSCIISIQTNDGKYVAYCAITVENDEQMEFHELENVTLNVL